MRGTPCQSRARHTQGPPVGKLSPNPKSEAPGPSVCGLQGWEGRKAARSEQPPGAL